MTVKPACSNSTGSDNPNNPIAIVGMSGGVDSSVTALLLSELKYQVIGVTLHLYDNETIGLDSRTCCSLEDVEDARRTCWDLHCRHYTLNRKDEFLRDVIDPFVNTYKIGNTPNPCIDCNKKIKFPMLYQAMRELGGSVISTGHYAQIEKSGDLYLLKKGKDAKKDQSYMLYTLSQEILSHLVLPLGKYTKDEIREIASQYGLSSAKKPDSQDICFVPDGDYMSFIERHTGERSQEGVFLSEDDSVLGTNRGYMGYTIGQRKGLGVSASSRLYVYEKDPKANTVKLGAESRIYSSETDVNNINLIGLDNIEKPLRAKAKIRYHHSEQPCTIVQTDEDRLHITFDEPQRAIASGQSLVMYQDDYVLGGGVIV